MFAWILAWENWLRFGLPTTRAERDTNIRTVSKENLGSHPRSCLEHAILSVILRRSIATIGMPAAAIHGAQLPQTILVVFNLAPPYVILLAVRPPIIKLIRSVCWRVTHAAGAAADRL